MAVKVDIISGSGVVEEFGYITQLIRRAHVKGFFSTTSGRLAAVLSQPGLPLPGDVHPDNSSYILGPRNVQPSTPNSFDSFYVDLVYTTTAPILRGIAAVSQIGTMIHRKAQTGGTSPPAAGAPINVKYTGDTSGTSPQGVEIHPFSAEHTIFGELLEATNTPATTANTFINKLNSATWQGFAAKSVFCTHVGYEPYVLSSATKWWKFFYEFQVRELRLHAGSVTNAWNPEIAFIRPETGRPPHDAVPSATATWDGDGVAMIDWYDTVDFNTKFP